MSSTVKQENFQADSGQAASPPPAIGFANPSHVLLITIAAIFIAEVMVMLFLDRLPPLSSSIRALFDGSILSLLLLPPLYVLVYRPLRLEIETRKKAECEKDALIVQLRKALAEVKALQGIIPICASCKNIRDDDGYWQGVESYIASRSQAEFSHGLCPGCVEKLYPGLRRRDGSSDGA